jgi:hypothetical protein
LRRSPRRRKRYEFGRFPRRSRAVGRVFQLGGATVIVLVTERTPDPAQAVSSASSRSAQEWTVPPNVTSPSWAVTVTCRASVTAWRLKESSICRLRSLAAGRALRVMRFTTCVPFLGVGLDGPGQRDDPVVDEFADGGSVHPRIPAQLEFDVVSQFGVGFHRLPFCRCSFDFALVPARGQGSNVTFGVGLGRSTLSGPWGGGVQ